MKLNHGDLFPRTLFDWFLLERQLSPEVVCLILNKFSWTYSRQLFECQGCFCFLRVLWWSIVKWWISVYIRWQEVSHVTSEYFQATDWTSIKRTEEPFCSTADQNFYRHCNQSYSLSGDKMNSINILASYPPRHIDKLSSRRSLFSILKLWKNELEHRCDESDGENFSLISIVVNSFRSTHIEKPYCMTLPSLNVFVYLNRFFFYFDEFLCLVIRIDRNESVM